MLKSMSQRELTVLVPISEVELVNRVKERVYKSDESPDDIDWRSLLSFVDGAIFTQRPLCWLLLK